MKQVTIMAIILSIYSAVLVLAVWQESENEQAHQHKRGDHPNRTCGQ